MFIDIRLFMEWLQNEQNIRNFNPWRMFLQVAKMKNKEMKESKEIDSKHRFFSLGSFVTLCHRMSLALYC